MEEKKKLKITANKKIVTFSLIVLALLVLVSTSYAYFTAVITGNDTAKKTTVTSATMSVKLLNTEEINLNGMMPGESKDVHFSVENTGTAIATYGVGLLVSENSFADKTDLVYTITSDNAGGSKTQSQLPSKSSTISTLIPVVSIPVGTTQNYTMTITFRETNDNQNDNQGKTFSGKVQLVGTETNMLATRILSDNTVKTNPVWSETSTDKGVYKLSGDKTIDGNPTYYYRGNVENNYVKFGKVEYFPIFYTNSKDVSDEVYNCFGNPANTSYEENNNCVYNTEGATMITPLGADLIWRIVRIAEDGSIRLILDTNEAQLFKFQNSGALGENFENYTLEYVSSPIESELNYIMLNNLNSEEINKLYSSKICNTGLITEENYSIDEYDGKQFIDSNRDMINDTLACLEEEKIDVSISMITAPEVYYASTIWRAHSGEWDYNSYFNSFADRNISKGFLTMSLGYDWDKNLVEKDISDYFGTYSKGNPYTIWNAPDNAVGSADVIDDLSYYYDSTSPTPIGIRPVINLNPNVKVLNSGDGTKDNPYVIE